MSGKPSTLAHTRIPPWAHPDTTTGARAVPARSTFLDRGGFENSRVCTLDKPLRTGTVRGPSVGVSKCALPPLVTRRHFLSNTALGLGGVALAWLLSREQARAVTSSTRQPH